MRQSFRTYLAQRIREEGPVGDFARFAGEGLSGLVTITRMDSLRIIKRRDSFEQWLEAEAVDTAMKRAGLAAFDAWRRDQLSSDPL